MATDLGTKTIETGDWFRLTFRHDTGRLETVEGELLGVCMDLTHDGKPLLLFDEGDGTQSIDLGSVVSVEVGGA